MTRQGTIDPAEQGGFASVSSTETKNTALDAVVEGAMAKWTVPGMTVGIFRDGETSLHGYGVSSLETEYPMRPDTILQIGSISKIFTTTLLMKLVDDGKVNLDHPVSNYLPDLKLTTDGTEETVRVRDLVTHTSGVYGDHFEDFGWGDDALAKYVDSMAELRQVYEPGTIWSYTNSGFNLAGRIIETILDKPFEEAVREHIFEPLKMDRSGYFPHDAITYPVSVGHTLVEPDGDEHEVARRWPIPRASGPAGSISSNVEDMLKFARMHLQGGTANGQQVISEESAKAMQEVQVDTAGLADAWGLGWQINFVDGTKVIGHGGSTNGFNAHLDIVPDQNFAMCVLTNSGRGAAAYGEVIKWALEHYCGLKDTDPEPVELSADELQQFAGKYSQPLADITVSVDGGTIRLDAVAKSALSDTDEDKPQPPVHAAPVGDDRFVITEGARAGGLVDFIRNQDGSIRFIRYGGRVSDRVS
jgi:CubicO group peptidase (beta-lactamase class C family)